MINQINKHVNHLSWEKLMNLEMQEHNLKSKPTKSEYLQMEKKEHHLKKVPSARTALKAEAVEHAPYRGNVVVNPSKSQMKKATSVYRRGK